MLKEDLQSNDGCLNHVWWRRVDEKDEPWAHSAIRRTRYPAKWKCTLSRTRCENAGQQSFKNDVRLKSGWYKKAWSAVSKMVGQMQQDLVSVGRNRGVREASTNRILVVEFSARFNQYNLVNRSSSRTSEHEWILLPTKKASTTDSTRFLY